MSVKFLLGRKRGMTQIFDDSGQVHGVTVVEAGPCVVTEHRTNERNGYQAVQIGFEDVREKRLNKSLSANFKKHNLPPKRHLQEIRIQGEVSVKPGDALNVEVFEVGELVDVIGTSKGKGFQGTVRAHHFAMGVRSHGSMNIRQPGTVGAGTGTKKVFRGLRMAKHLGDQRCTTKNLEIKHIDKDKNLLFLAGPVPGMRGSLVMVRKAKTGIKSTPQKKGKGK